MIEEIEKFIREINTLRKNSITGWYMYSGVVNGKNIKIKAYKTWLQIYEIDGLKHSCGMDISVKDFKTELLKPFIKEL